MDSKVTLGFFGVLMEISSVTCSMGFFAYIGVKSTPIIPEVIPFLVLAIGVDNLFLIVQTYERGVKRAGEGSAEYIGRVLGQVGPCMLLTSASESCCFFLGES